MGRPACSMEGVVMGFWKDKRVLITGDTGFKGSWLTLWLQEQGAEVFGLSLSPSSSPSLFNLLFADPHFSHRGDIRNADEVLNCFQRIQPEIVFHLAAQSLVKPSYTDPAGTFSTNVMGTVHVLEAIKATPSVKTALIVSSDKCYEPSTYHHAFVETDAMGGHDPYSASKGCTELVASAYIHSFFHSQGPNIVTGRAGNVIGGGDWSADRLIPDIVRAVHEKKPLVIRNPNYVRPWQHVLDLTQGYVTLVQQAWENQIERGSSWNFGPLDRIDTTVKDVVDHALNGLIHHSSIPVTFKPAEFSENPYLALNASKSHQYLKWTPKLSVKTALSWTFEWYDTFYKHNDIVAFTKKQLQDYWTLA
jgi:CDP-glucose 4,6-dehydratase